MRRLPLIALLVLGFTGIGIRLENNSYATDRNEQLIVILQGEQSRVEASFRKESLPAIQELADDMKIPLSIINTDKGVPADVAITPLVVYQNHFGRSIYQGRSTTLTRIRNFIRTSRYIPQGAEKLKKEDIPLWEMGRARVWSPLKISAVTGTPPPDYEDVTFKRDALQAVYEGFEHFRYHRTAMLGRADRGFYMDFYPWCSPDGTLYLSLALFSQFHCKEPVFHTGDNPLTGPWENRMDLFREGAALLEKVVADKIADDDGDGFSPIDQSVAITSWDKLGFSLPPKPERISVKPVNSKIPTRWKLTVKDRADSPQIMFRFPAPLDNASGEARQSEGSFNLPADLVASGARGNIRVYTGSVTMGQTDLDKVIHSSMMLDVTKYPAATFSILAGEGEGEPLTYGALSPVRYSGEFTMRGKTVPLTATMEIEPILDDDGKPALVMRGGFKIDLTPFHIEGPDGPAPQKHTLLFDVHFILEPGEPI